MSQAELLLAQLERVQRVGKGWRADCPKGHRSRGSLSIAEGDNGAVLLKCWSGCTPLEVLDGLGMAMADLFPGRRDIRDLTPAERTAMREGARQAGWKAALGVLDREATLVAIAAGMVQQGEGLAPEDQERLGVSLERIADARAVLNG